MKIFGGLEAGGTKMICVVGSGPDMVLARAQFPTSSPDETIGLIISFFNEQKSHFPMASIGIGAFGPLDLHIDSPTFGYITNTPKPGWQYIDLAGKIQQALNIPTVIDTDVNAAALAEHLWGAGQGLDPLVYFTIGTGIGGGGIINGKLMHGLVHPEAGHVYLPHDIKKDPFPGCCPFHKDCFEGLASGTAMLNRWGQRAEVLPVDHPAWTLEAEYIALALVNVICTLSPRRIILGGGVMNQEALFPLIRRNVALLLASYIQSPAVLDGLEHFIVPPGLGGSAGVMGALALAYRNVPSHPEVE